MRKNKKNDIGQQKMIESVQKYYLLFRWVFPVLAVALACLWFSQLYYFYSDFHGMMKQNPRALIGIPVAMIFATALIILFEKISGKIEVKVPGFQFKGASGPLVLWCLIFSLIVGSIAMLW